MLFRTPDSQPPPSGPTSRGESVVSPGPETQLELVAAMEETETALQQPTQETEDPQTDQVTTTGSIPLNSLDSLLQSSSQDHSMIISARHQFLDSVQKASFTQKASSTGTTPVGSRSPVCPNSPVRSRTPDPTLFSLPSLPTSLITEKRSPVRLGAPSQSLTTPVNSPSSKTDRALVSPEPKPVSLPVRKVVKKPGLDSQALRTFFQNSVSKEKNEVVLNVLWGGCAIPASSSCDIEAGLIITDKSVYLVEVMDPRRHPRKQFSWGGGNLPLMTVFYSPVVTLSRITVGIFDQSLLIEFVEKGAFKSFVMFPRTYEQTIVITENLKAALDAVELGHHIMTSQEAILNPLDSGALFINPDATNLQKLKESLARGKTLVQVSNFLVAAKTQDINISLEDEVKKITQDSSSKFDIVQYVVVGELSTDILPIGNGNTYLKSRALVLTNSTLYLCKEEVLAWPRENSNAIKPPFPQCSVLAMYGVAQVAIVKICDRAQPIVSYSDPVYEFVIGFKVLESESTVFSEWKLCVQDRQYIDQFLNCLCQLYQDTGQGELSIIHTADAISQPPSTPQAASTKSSSNAPARMDSSNATSKTIAFFHSEVLVNFAGLRNYQRLKYFKKYVAQAEFLKSDEVPLSVFLAHCSFSSQEYAEIEACVMVSNYAIYLVSDVDNIRTWLDKGGPSSFARMSLLSRKKDVTQTRCFYRLWLKEIKEVTVHLFYLSVRITENKSGVSFVIHTENASATLSFLSALSFNLNLQDSVEEEEISELLSDYIDLTTNALSGKAQKVQKSLKPNVELLHISEVDLDNFKKTLLKISPTITRNSSVEKCAATLRILCQQVMLLVEEVRIRDSLTTQAHPHLVLLTNYGLFVCVNAIDGHSSPSVSLPSNLKVKKWCHIDLVDHVDITNPLSSVYSQHTIKIYLRSQKLPGTEDNTLCLLVQNTELLNYFLHIFSLLWHERTGRQLPIHKT